MSEANCGLFSRTTVSFIYEKMSSKVDLRILYTDCSKVLFDFVLRTLFRYSLLHSWWISLLRLWNQDLPYIYNYLSLFLWFHLVSSLFAASLIFQHQISHSCRARASYLWFFFYYKTNILVRELNLTCLSIEWCWNEEKFSIQLLLL